MLHEYSKGFLDTSQILEAKYISALAFDFRGMIGSDALDFFDIA